MDASSQRALDCLDDAVLNPSQWPSAVEALASLAGATGGAILSRSHGFSVWGGSSSEAKHDFYGKFYNNPIQDGMTSLRAAAGGRAPPVVTDRHLMPRAAFIRTPYFNEFMVPRGAGAAMVVELSGRGVSGALNLTTTAHKDGFTDDELRAITRAQPQIGRSFWLSLQLGIRSEAANALASELDRCSNGVFVVNETARVTYCNHVAEALALEGDAVCVTQGRLRAATPALTNRLEGLIAAAAAAGGEPGVGAMSIDTAHRRRPLMILVTPARADRYAAQFNARSALVCVIDPDRELTTTAGVLRDLFGLSPAETRVALWIYKGATARETARELGLSFTTVRSHVAHILKKTQTGRLTELVRLLARVMGAAVH